MTRGETARPGWGDPVRVDVVTHWPDHDPAVVESFRNSIASLLDREWRGAGGHAVRSGDHRLDLIDDAVKATLTLRLENARNGLEWIVETPRPKPGRAPDAGMGLRHALMIIEACAVPTPRDAVRSWILGMASMLRDDGVMPRGIRLNGPYGGFDVTELRVEEDRRPRLVPCRHPLVERFSAASPIAVAVSWHAGGDGECPRIVVHQDGGVIGTGSANHPDTDPVETLRALAIIAPHLKDPA